MRKFLILLIMLLTLSTLLAACGGGGGGGGGGTGTAEPAQAIVTLSTSGSLPAGVQIGGIDLIVTLPSGISVKATADGMNANVFVTDAGVLVAAGAAAGPNTTAIGTTAASSTELAIKVINPAGFGTGEFATVACDIAPGSTVAATDIIMGTLSVVDLDGAAITGLTAGVTVELR